MVDLKLRYMPAFVSPLTNKQLAQLGRIAVVWGHNDFILDELLIDVIGITTKQRSLLIGEKPIGAKLELLKSHIKDIENEEIRKEVAEFHRILNETKGQRNSAFHGCWGWRAVEKTKKVEICARHPKTLDNPLRPAALHTLEKRLVEASRLGFDALARFKSWPTWNGVTRFFHRHGGEPPEWLVRWKERNLLRDEILDQSWKEGELPRLAETEE